MNRKLYTLALSVMLISVMVSVMEAREADSAPGTLYEAVDLSRLSIRFAGDYDQRGVEWQGVREDTLDIISGYGMISYDLLSWLTIGAGAGRTWMTVDDLEEVDDDGSLWLLDARLNLWSYNLYDPKFLESRLRIDSSLSYWNHSLDFDLDDVNWYEFRGSLTISTEFYAEGFGENIRCYPYSTKLFAGVFYSSTDLDDKIPATFSGVVIEGGLQDEAEFGIIFGANLFISHNLCLGFEGRVFEDADTQTSLGGSLSYHF